MTFSPKITGINQFHKDITTSPPSTTKVIPKKIPFKIHVFLIFLIVFGHKYCFKGFEFLQFSQCPRLNTHYRLVFNLFFVQLLVDAPFSILGFVFRRDDA